MLTKQQALALLQKPLAELTDAEKRQLQQAMKLALQLSRPVG